MVEADFSRKNMDRYAAQRARAVGGPHGRRHFIQPFDPSAQLLFFDGFVQIDSTQAGTNLFGSGTLQFIDEFRADPDIDAKHEVIQLFLKAERPFNNIRSLVIPFGPNLPTQVATFGSIGGGGTFTATQSLQFALLRVPMSIGASPVNPFALDQLTWNNSHAVIAGFGGTTALYATASNIELFLASKLYGQNFGILNPDPFESFQVSAQARGTSYSFDRELAQSDNGLFFGIHIFWKPALQGGAPLTTNGAIGTLDGELEGILFNAAKDLARVYAVTDSFPVMKGS